MSATTATTAAAPAATTATTTTAATTAAMAATSMPGMNSGRDDRGVVIVAVGIIIIWGVIVRVRVIIRIVVIAVWIIVPVPRISRARCQSENQAHDKQIARPHCHHLSGFPGPRPGPAREGRRPSESLKCSHGVSAGRRRAARAAMTHDQPTTIMSMPINRPITHSPDTGHCLQIKTPSARVMTPLTSSQPQ